LTTLTFRLESYIVASRTPWLSHGINIALHAITTVALCLYMRCIQEFRESTSIAASLLFAVHPIHAEAVTGVVGRAEILSLFLSLVSMACYQPVALKEYSRDGRERSFKNRLIDWARVTLACLLAVMAALCKETGLSVIGLFWVIECLSLLTLVSRDGGQGGGSRLGKVTYGGALIRIFFTCTTALGFLLFRRWHAGGVLAVGHEVKLRIEPDSLAT